MTLPSSGSISMQDIVNEFGGSPVHSLDEYYRGGALVPNIAQNNSIPTAGQISLDDFYGAGSGPVSVTVDVTVGRGPGAVATDGIDIGWVDGSSITWSTLPWPDPGSITSSNINGNILRNIGFRDSQDGTSSFAGDFHIEFVGNVTSNGLTSVTIEDINGSSTINVSNARGFAFLSSFNTTSLDWDNLDVPRLWTLLDVNQNRTFSVTFTF